MSLAGSLDDWNKGPYGRLLRFCDTTTFANVVKLWQLYALEKSNGKAYTEAQAMLNGQWKVAKQFKESKIIGQGTLMDGLLSSAPLLAEGYKDVTKLYQVYWQSGTCLEDKKALKGLTIANPMFACSRSGLMLHYGLNPISGFHLAPLVARLSTDSPLASTQSESAKDQVPKAMQMAICQLSGWSAAFREATERLTIRYVNCDAVAFCHVLQYQHMRGESRTAYWYRNMWTYTPLVLDTVDYKDSGGAPTTFDVIDTSNLLDHVGCLNVLAATASLIRQGPASMLRTEILLPPEINVAASAKKLLCGDLPTVALLLGLKPIQHWTNATPVWHMSYANLPREPYADKISAAMSRPIVLWKPCDTTAVHYEAGDLAKLVLDVYLSMFQDEGWANRFAMLGLQDKELVKKKITSYELYTRASFAAVLQHIKVSDVVNWSEFMQALVPSIMNDPTLNMGAHHFQSLFVHLAMLGLWKPEDHFDWWYPKTHELKGLFRGWQQMPPFVCVTLVVPHATVSMFGDLSKGNGTPICELWLNSSVSSKQAFYTDIQMGFGSLKPSGTAFTNDFCLAIQEDDKGWKGRSPLVVSAMVSTDSLVEYGDEACNVVFALKNTPANLLHFTSKFGFMLQMHQSAVGRKDVFISRHRPNMHGHGSVNTLATSRSDEGKFPYSISCVAEEVEYMTVDTFACKIPGYIAQRHT
jgi:hypothetical protein